MCLLIIEILFFISGVWLLVSGKVPGGLFQIMFGKGDYRLSPLHARLFGLLLASPLPVVFGVSMLIAILFGQDQVASASIFEIVYDVIVVIIAIIIARRSRSPLQ
jgi:hypothetical protein